MIEQLNLLIGRAYDNDILHNGVFVGGISSLDIPWIISSLFLLFVVVSIVKSIFTFISGIVGFKL